MQVPTVRTFADPPDPASILTYAEWNSTLLDTLNLILNPPMVHVRQINSQNISTNVWTAITFDTEIIDTEGAHSNTTNPTRVTPKTAGWYMGWYGTSWGGNSTGLRAMALRKNGNMAVSAGSYGRVDWRPITTAGMALKGFRFWMPFNGTTDYVEVVSWQASGTTVGTFNAAEEVYPELYLRWWRTL